MTDNKQPIEDESGSNGWGITRRGVLRTSAALGAVGIFGVPAMGSVAANAGETLYLTDSGIVGNDGNGTILFRVTLDDASNEAVLTKLADLDPNGFDQVDALAASPDGSKVYAIDKASKRLGVYDVSSSSFTDSGTVGSLPGGVVQAAFSPDGVLYIASDSGDDLYVVDPSVPEVTSTINFDDSFGFQGADIVFAADGTLYIFTNQGDSNGTGLYKVPDISTATEPVSPAFVGQPDRPYFTGLAIRNDGTGDLVASAHTYDEGTKNNSDGTGANDVSRLFTLDPGTGLKIEEYDTVDEAGNTYYLGYGDMTVGRLAPTTTTRTFDLCAGQDIPVGTVSVTQSTDMVEVTYDTTGGWLLYETHVDVAGSKEGLTTNNPGNPQVGQFDSTKSHDGTTTATHTFDCGDLSDVGATLFVATHAVVRPADGCVNFGALEPGDSVEGLGTVNPVLNIESTSSVAGAKAVAQHEGETPASYGAPNASGTVLNGCLDDYGNGAFGGFSDVVTKDAAEPHAYSFTFADDVTASDFSLRMLDFGDYNPSKNSHHYAKMVAYDADGNVVDTHELEYWSDGLVNPILSYADAGKTTTKWTNSLYEAGDACDADVSQGEPGNWVWSVSGEQIKRVELTFGDGHDPNIAFTDLCFEATDETAWVCDDQDDVYHFVDKGNWATYVMVDSILDCSNS